MKNGKEKYKYFFKNYSLIFIPIVLVVAVIVAQSLSVFKDTLAIQETEHEVDHLEMTSSFVGIKLHSAVHDLTVLSRDTDFIQYISEDFLADEVADNWIDFLGAQDYYSEVRYLNLDGHQILQVDTTLSRETTNQGVDFTMWEEQQKLSRLHENEILTLVISEENISLVKAIYDINSEKTGYLMLSSSPKVLFGELQLLISKEEQDDYIITLNQDAIVSINKKDVKIIDIDNGYAPEGTVDCTSNDVSLNYGDLQGYPVVLLDDYSVVHCFSTGEEIQNTLSMIMYGAVVIVILAALIYGAFLNIKWHREVQYSNAIFLSNTLKIINKTLRHDVLNNITIIKFNLELLDSKNPLIGDVNDAVARTTELIEDMRILEKNSLGDFFATKVNLPKLIREIVVDFRDDLHIRVSGKGMSEVDSAFNSVVENIVRNTIAHARAKKLDIHIFEDKDFVVVEFSDDGRGVPERLKIEIFEEGFKYGPTGHTGLGLFIVKTTVERYGGHVYVEDNTPKGSTFIIKLPK